MADSASSRSSSVWREGLLADHTGGGFSELSSEEIVMVRRNDAGGHASPTPTAAWSQCGPLQSRGKQISGGPQM
jgi:hypothetical protein